MASASNPKLQFLEYTFKIIFLHVNGEIFTWHYRITPINKQSLLTVLMLAGMLSFTSVQFSHSVVSSSAVPWTAACQASLSITNSQSFLKFMSIEPVMPSNHLILCRPLLLPPSIFPSIRVFSNESVLPIRRTKYYSFSFGISPSNGYSGLISFRMDWLGILDVQGTLKSSTDAIIRE